MPSSLRAMAKAGVCAAALSTICSGAFAQDCDKISQLGLLAASDDGDFDAEYGPERAIDGSFNPESRWSSEGSDKALLLDMGAPQTLTGIGVAYYKGNERRSGFRLESSIDGETFTEILEESQTGGETTAIEQFAVDPVEARYLRLVGLGNEASEWNSLLEVQAFGCGSGEIASTGDGSEVALEDKISAYGLRTDLPPSENFDLTRWKITLPVDRDGNGKVDEIEENQLQGWSDPEFFYTDPVTGGMVFRAVPGGATTPNSSYIRSELREMMRGGDESISTRHRRWHTQQEQLGVLLRPGSGAGAGRRCRWHVARHSRGEPGDADRRGGQGRPGDHRADPRQG